MKKEKFLMPITILLSAIILGVSYFTVQINKQQSIEKQQRLKIEFDETVETQKMEKEKREIEKEERDYVIKRRNDCSEIEQRERKNWNNVDGHHYDEIRDICIIRYKDNKYNKLICDEKLQKSTSTSTMDISSLIRECHRINTKEY